jgi:hypothetical protein
MNAVTMKAKKGREKTGKGGVVNVLLSIRSLREHWTYGKSKD